MSVAQEWDSMDAADGPVGEPDYTVEELDNKIHELTARQLLAALSEPDCSPGMIQCALRFLKDNDITALPIPGSHMERIAGKLDLPYPRITHASDEATGSRSDD